MLFEKAMMRLKKMLYCCNKIVYCLFFASCNSSSPVWYTVLLFKSKIDEKKTPCPLSETIIFTEMKENFGKKMFKYNRSLTRIMSKIEFCDFTFVWRLFSHKKKISSGRGSQQIQYRPFFFSFG